MREFRLKALDHFLARPVPQWGANLNQIDFDDIHYFVRASERAEHSWDDVPDDIKNTFDKLGIPEAERNFLAGVGAQYESEVVYHQVRKDLEELGRPVPRHGHRPARARGHHPRALRDGDPGQRQHAGRAQLGRLVGRLVRLRAAGRQGRDAAAGLLPDQHREHGPVRADADHRRRGLRRALHRGLHRPGLLDRLAALRGRRADRPPRRADPLHDRPELVAERLQPRHEAGDRRARRHRRVGRLQPRLEDHDEVPVDLPDGRAGARRDPLDRLRRRRPAPGRRRQDHPRRAEDDLVDLRRSRSPRTAAARPTAACSRSPRARPRHVRRSSATRCCSTPSRARTPTRRSGSTRTTPTSATRPRSRRSARSSSSTCRRTASTRKRPRR